MDASLRTRLVKLLVATFTEEELKDIIRGLEEGDWVLVNVLYNMLEEESHVEVICHIDLDTCSSERCNT